MPLVHFDKAEVLRAFDGELKKVNAAVLGHPTKDQMCKALEIGTGPIQRAVMEWIIDARNGGAPHEVVAHSAGGLLAQIATMVATNYTCNCVPDRILASFGDNFEAMLAGDPNVRVSDGVAVEAMRSGRA